MAAPAPMGAGAATLLVSPNGDLFGARGVDVGGTLYDVTFQGGSCVDVFGECDSADDFTIAFADRVIFAQALLDQVFVGVFDTDPERTLGCSSTVLCNVVVAGQATLDPGRVAMVYALNRSDGGADQVLGFSLPEGFASNQITFASFASFAAAAAIPLPAAGWGLLAGVGGLAALRRRAARRPAP